MDEELDLEFLQTVCVNTQEVSDDLSDEQYDEVWEETKRVNRYLDKIEINKFSQNTERLKTALHIVRSFCPGYNLYVKEGFPQQDGDMPGKLQQSQDRALISAWRQIERICNTDISLP